MPEAFWSVERLPTHFLLRVKSEKRTSRGILNPGFQTETGIVLELGDWTTGRASFLESSAPFLQNKTTGFYSILFPHLSRCCSCKLVVSKLHWEIWMRKRPKPCPAGIGGSIGKLHEHVQLGEISKNFPRLKLNTHFISGICGAPSGYT